MQARIEEILSELGPLDINDLLDELRERGDAPRSERLLKRELRENAHMFSIGKDGYVDVIPVDRRKAPVRPSTAPEVIDLTTPQNPGAPVARHQPSLATRNRVERSSTPKTAASRPTRQPATESMTPARRNRLLLEAYESRAPWAALERELRGQLKGRRLVSEIDLNARLRNRIAEVWPAIATISRTPIDIAMQAPACLAALLVTHGIYEYQRHGFWSNFEVKGIDHSFGKAFDHAIRNLELETFDQIIIDEPAQRYVSRILAHGGIPKSALKSFFPALIDALAQGHTTADAVLTYWRTHSSVLGSVTTPVRRFMLYGGAVSHDYLARCIDLVQLWTRSEGDIRVSPAEAGLPAYLIAEFRRLTQDGVLRRSDVTARRRRRVPMPRLTCDTFDRQAPVIELPAVDRSFEDTVWVITEETGTRRFPASCYADQYIDVDRSRSWRVELRRGAELISDSRFEGLDHLPALFFDASGALIPPGIGIQEGDITVLRQRAKAIKGVVGDDLVTLDSGFLFDGTGKWSGFVAETIRIKDVNALAFLDAEANVTRTLSVRNVVKPTLHGTVVDGVREVTGATVRSGDVHLHLPESEVPWNVTLEVDGLRHQLSEDTAQSVGFGGLLPSDRAASVRLTARGPLGADLRENFLWVPNFAVTIPNKLLLPSDGSITIPVRSATVPWSSPTQTGLGVTVAAASDTAVIKLEGLTEPREVHVKVARLRWGLAGGVNRPAAADALTVTTTDLESAEGLGLTVTSGGRPIEFRLRLSCDNQVVQETSSKQAAHGRTAIRFDLARFRDTVVKLGRRCDLTLHVGPAEFPVPVARLVPAAMIDGLHVDLDTSCQTVSLNYASARAVSDRVLRLWAEHRPWDPPHVVPIPDGSEPPYEFRLSAPLRLGSYLAEVVVDDGWGTPTRPHCVADGCVTLTVGTAAALQTQLERLGEHDPWAVLERTLAFGDHPHLSTRQASFEIVGAAISEWARIRRLDVSDRRLTSLANVMRAAREVLAEHVLGAYEREILDRSDLLHLAIELTQRRVRLWDEPVLRTLFEAEPTLGMSLVESSESPGLQTLLRDTLGWCYRDGFKRVPVGQPVDQLWVSRDPQQLDLIKDFLQTDLVPRPLSSDGMIDATIEWLSQRADGSRDRALEIVQRYGAKFPIDHDRSGSLIPHLAAQSAPAGTEPVASFGKVVLLAAFHLVASTAAAPAAQRVLHEAAEFAPALVRRNLLIAQIHHALTAGVAAEPSASPRKI